MTQGCVFATHLTGPRPTTGRVQGNSEAAPRMMMARASTSQLHFDKHQHAVLTHARPGAVTQARHCAVGACCLPAQDGRCKIESRHRGGRYTHIHVYCRTWAGTQTHTCILPDTSARPCSMFAVPSGGRRGTSERR